MNLYTSLLFLHGHIADPRVLAPYGKSYGNRVANDRLLRERWEPGERLPGREDDIGSVPKAA